MTIGRIVKAEMILRGITVGDLVNKTSLGRTALSERLNGHKDFKNSELEEIGNALGTPAWELMRRAEEVSVA